MATGTVKSFNPAKGYGFIKTDAGGAEVFVHLSAVREAGLADLRKGQKISFEIFDNQGKAAAKNLHIDRAMEDESDHNPDSANNGPEIVQSNMNQKKTEEPIKKRTWIARAALESALAENVRGSDPQCEGLIAIGPSKASNMERRSAKYAALRYPRLWKKVSASSKFRTGPRRWWSVPITLRGVSPT